MQSYRHMPSRANCTTQSTSSAVLGSSGGEYLAVVAVNTSARRPQACPAADATYRLTRLSGCFLLRIRNSRQPTASGQRPPSGWRSGCSICSIAPRCHGAITAKNRDPATTPALLSPLVVRVSRAYELRISKRVRILIRQGSEHAICVLTRAAVACRLCASPSGSVFSAVRSLSATLWSSLRGLPSRLPR